MSTPARRLPTPIPQRRVPSLPERRGARAPARAPRGRGVPRRAAATSKRLRHHLGFAIFASTVVGLTVLAIVVLHVLLAQQSFRIDAAEQRVDALTQERLQLVTERATLSAPGRIADWASRHGMRLPDDIRILRAPSGPSDPAGAGTSPGGEG
jgi:cell division protein FtsL